MVMPAGPATLGNDASSEPLADVAVLGQGIQRTLRVLAARTA
jgi:hypothetical protein